MAEQVHAVQVEVRDEREVFSEPMGFHGLYSREHGLVRVTHPVALQAIADGHVKGYFFDDDHTITAIVGSVDELNLDELESLGATLEEQIHLDPDPVWTGGGQLWGAHFAGEYDKRMADHGLRYQSYTHLRDLGAFSLENLGKFRDRNDG